MRTSILSSLRYTVLCFAICLSACSSLTPSSPTNASQLPTTREYHQQIEMSGRLSAQYEANNKPQAVHINFSWSQTPQQTLITLGSPTGQTLATILINAQGAQLTQADKAPRFASDANQLFIDMLGWPLPIAGLKDWLQGFITADHATPITEATSNNALVVDGWLLRYASWQTENNVERPKRLDLSRQTEPAGLVSLRIVVDEWNGQ
ncbi:lipoprotein insertase outer membrane protein LolB [Solimicrobium silvestre]|uniref:Outer-membrane lipoprotein LolB n=1 Tax=Solimicrobium silvestre TaxID=2099400 RepID=A0A2S9H1B3_9BURK|nr:lipoprotein insertase outer membrane protein LolB [Solimicrobium silvestre]PRC93772.1 lolB: outer membrane lipoprotein LolB [Solimicrobium silvestre]